MDYSLLYALVLLGGVLGFYWLINHFAGRKGDEDESAETAEEVGNAAREAAAKGRKGEEQ